MVLLIGMRPKSMFSLFNYCATRKGLKNPRLMAGKGLRCCSFDLAVNACGTNYTQSFHFCKFYRKICCMIVFGIPVHSAMSLHKNQRPSFKISATRATTFLRVVVIVGLLLFCSSRINSRPSENALYQRNTSTMYSKLNINFLNHFNCFCGIKTGFPTKTKCCMLFNCFFHYNL